MQYTLHEQLLVVDNITVRYGKKTVLRDLSMEIRNIRQEGFIRGQVVGVCSPSGVGKSTLFRCIAAQEKPTLGEIYINEDLKPVRPGEVGVVAQDYPLLETRTVLSNLELAAHLSGVTKAEANERAIETLNMFDLLHIKDHYPPKISGGQRQRIAILQQMLCSRFFLLMDEPFSGLDPVSKEKVCELIIGIASGHEFNTLVVTSHDVRTLLAVADWVVLLGRDRDADGNIIPGARIQKDYDLKDLGLCWNPEIRFWPQFAQLVGEVENQFNNL